MPAALHVLTRAAHVLCRYDPSAEAARPQWGDDSETPPPMPQPSPKASRSPSPRRSSTAGDDGGRRRIQSTYAQTWSFSSEGLLMYPLAKILCPPLRTLGVTPNMITIFNIFVGMGSGYALRALPSPPGRTSLLPG